MLSVVVTGRCPHANRKLLPVLMQASLMRNSGSHVKTDTKVRGSYEEKRVSGRREERREDNGETDQRVCGQNGEQISNIIMAQK